MGKNMKVIDFEKKGNVVRLYLGKDDLTEWYGDDWNDTPYEHNAGTVYSEYVSGFKDLMFPYDWNVFEPCDGELNSPYCKDDMKSRRVPCIIAVPPLLAKDSYWDDFKYWVWADGVTRIYFGDKIEDLKFSIPIYGEAEWVPRNKDGTYNGGAKCSNCKKPERLHTKMPSYCSKCGCRMINGDIENWRHDNDRNGNSNKTFEYTFSSK